MKAQLQEIISNGRPPAWMTMGRTVSVVKYSTKGNVPSNYRPITCLPVMWKLLTGVIAEVLYQHIDDNEVLPWEQIGCAKGRRGTKDQLCIDKGIMKDCKRRETNLAMAWVDYKKAYDMVPHSWILEVFVTTDSPYELFWFVCWSRDHELTVCEISGLRMSLSGIVLTPLARSKQFAELRIFRVLPLKKNIGTLCLFL